MPFQVDITNAHTFIFQNIVKYSNILQAKYLFPHKFLGFYGGDIINLNIFLLCKIYVKKKNSINLPKLDLSLKMHFQS